MLWRISIVVAVSYVRSSTLLADSKREAKLGEWANVSSFLSAIASRSPPKCKRLQNRQNIACLSFDQRHLEECSFSGWIHIVRHSNGSYGYGFNIGQRRQQKGRVVLRA